MKEAPVEVFNANVFKEVKLAMTPEGVKKEEDKVEGLAKFLKDVCITKLVKDLKSVEGVPRDSESLSLDFHQHGVNMRYLGEVYQRVEGFSHMRNLVEKDIVLRSAKHLIDQEMRESNDAYLSSCVAHLLNCLLAPQPFVEALDAGKIQFEDFTLQARLSSKEKQEDQTEVEKQGAEAEGESAAMTKNQKKKMKKKTKKQPNEEQTSESTQAT